MTTFYVNEYIIVLKINKKRMLYIYNIVVKCAYYRDKDVLFSFVNIIFFF